MNETYTVRDLIARLERVAAEASTGLETPVYLDAGDRQYVVDEVVFDDVIYEENPGVWIQSLTEVVES